MNEGRTYSAYLSHGTSTLETLLKFLKLYKSINEDMSLKIQKFLASIEITEENPTVSKSLEKLFDYIKSKSDFHSEISESLASVLIEPLEEYKSSFIIGYSQLQDSVIKSVDSLKASRLNLENLKQSYFKASLKAEKAAKMAKIEEDEHRVLLATQNYEIMRQLMLKASEDYLGALAKEKELWGEYDFSRKYGNNYLKELEDSRLQFCKRCFEKFSLLETKQQTLLSDFTSSFSQIYSSITSSPKDSEINKSLLECEDIEREDWISYEQWKKAMKSEGMNPLKAEEDYICNEIAYKPMNSSMALMKSLVYSMIPIKRKQSSDSSSTDRSTFMDTGTEAVEHDSVSDFSKILIDPNSWEAFLLTLESRKHASFIDLVHITSLAGLFSTIISLMLDEKLFSIEVFHKIIQLSHVFHTFDGRRKYLAEFISAHPIFSNARYWSWTLSFAVLSKLNSEKQLFKNTQKRLKRQGKKAQSPNKNSNKSTAASIMSQFNYFMTTLGTTIEVSQRVIFECGQKQNLGHERLFPIFIELHSMQTSQPVIVSGKKSTRVNMKSRSKWGVYLYLGLALDFLPIAELPVLMQVCKSWHSVVSGFYYKKALIDHSNTAFRRLAWASVLCKPNKKSFAEVVAELKSKPGTIKELEDVIHMDIFRSYANNPTLNSETLEEILKAYAYLRPKVGYCQGMHYIAGTLSQVLGEGSISFWALDELIRLHQMQELYSQDMSRLKINFFILDRLLSLHSPECRNLLNNENIASSNFSATWFITIFAGQLSNKPSLLLRIWDYFIFTGWKFIFRLSIVILKKIYPSICNKRFEEIMMVLTTPHHSAKEIFDESIIQEALSLKVSNRAVNQLKKEYEKLKKLVING